MEWLIHLGYLGLFLGTTLAGIVLPLSSDVLLLGVLVAGGNPWVCLIVATLGNWLGGMTPYCIGWLGNWERMVRWFNVKQDKLEKQKTVIDKYGVWLALFSWAPFVGTLSIIALWFYRIRAKLTTILVLISCLPVF